MWQHGPDVYLVPVLVHVPTCSRCEPPLVLHTGGVSPWPAEQARPCTAFTGCYGVRFRGPVARQTMNGIVPKSSSVILLRVVHHLCCSHVSVLSARNCNVPLCNLEAAAQVGILVPSRYSNQLNPNPSPFLAPILASLGECPHQQNRTYDVSDSDACSLSCKLILATPNRR